MKKILTIIISVLFFSQSKAQYGSGISIMPFHLSEVQVPDDIFFDIGMGYEQNLHQRISVGLDLTVGLGSSSDNYSISYSNSGGSYSVFYHHVSSFKQASFQSKYFFNDNDLPSWYLGSKLGFQMRTEKASVESTSQEFKQNMLLIPYNLSIGHRGSFDGVYVDYFVGVSFLIKGSDLKPTIPFASFRKYSSDMQADSYGFNDISVNYGIKIGFGWTRN